jgi:hypothetical protein
MPSEKKDTKRGSRMQSVDETNAALAKEYEDDARREQESLPQSGESKAPEVPPPKTVSVEDQVGSTVSTVLGFGSDGRPLYEPEGSIFPTNSHESDKIAKKLLTGLEREMSSRIQGPSQLLEGLKELGMAGDFSDDWLLYSTLSLPNLDDNRRC